MHRSKSAWLLYVVLAEVFAGARRSEYEEGHAMELEEMELEENMTHTEGIPVEPQRYINASDAVARGLIVARDYTPQTASMQDTATLVEINEHSNVKRGKTPACPRMTGRNRICPKVGPCILRNIVYVTVANAENLPDQFFDAVDPYVWFWVGNTGGARKFHASTTSFTNEQNPTYDWGCPFAYAGRTLFFDGEVWDDDFLKDDLVGEISAEGAIKIDEKFIKEYDKDGDGKFELGVYLFKKGTRVHGTGNYKAYSTINFIFELIRAPGYHLTKD